MDTEIQRTWDGQAISPEPPYGAMVVVIRRQPEVSVLLLHRAHHGLNYEGDWAWTPPSGARQPKEPIDAAASRELREEAGLILPAKPVPCGSEDWAVYLVEAGLQDRIQLIDPEHDRFIWLSPKDALARVAPDVVRDSLACVLTYIGIGRQGVHPETG